MIINTAFPRNGHAILRLLLLPFLLMASCLVHAQQPIKVGVYNFSPLVFIDEHKQVKGLYVDVLEWVAKQEGWNLQYVNGSWAQNLERLENGEIDLLMSIGSSEERLKKFDFTQQHLFLDWGLVYRQKGAAIDTLFDLQGKSVGVLKGSIYTTEFKKLLGQFGVEAKFIEKNEYADVFKALAARELDAGINANVSGSNLEGEYPIERTNILFAPIKLRFAVKKDTHGELMGTLDGHFQALYADKTSVYHEFYQKWTGLHGKSARVPTWILWTLAGLAATVSLLFGVSMLLKAQVRRKTAELVGTKNYYEQILLASPVGITTYNAAGQCLTSNAQAVRMFGSPQEQILQQNFRELESWKQSGLLQSAEVALATGHITRNEHHLDASFGKDIWIDAIFARFMADGQPHLVQIATDITGLKQGEAKIMRVSEALRDINETLEARIRDRTAQLETSNAALAASTQDLARSNLELEQFAYVASHDLQEPLRMVVGFVQLLEKRLADKLETETMEFMAFAVDGALRMQRLIQDILSYSRVNSRAAPCEQVDSATALQEALMLLDNQISNSGAQVAAHDLPVVSADRTQMVQLFQNLIGNAIKFCKNGAPRIQVQAQRHGKQWRFTVTDNGIGIEPEYRERIFGIFQRLHTRHEYEGTGIGLAICKRIVQRYGGEIGVDAAPGAGSVFWFTLAGEQRP